MQTAYARRPGGEDRAAGRASRDDRPRGSLCKVLEIVIKIDFRCGLLRRAVSRVPATLGLLEAHHEKLQLINAGIRVRTVPRAPGGDGPRPRVWHDTDGPRSQPIQPY